jgi:hypothetical protein
LCLNDKIINKRITNNNVSCSQKQLISVKSIQQIYESFYLKRRWFFSIWDYNVFIPEEKEYAVGKMWIFFFLQCFLTRISLNATIHESPFIKLYHSVNKSINQSYSNILVITNWHQMYIIITRRTTSRGEEIMLTFTVPHFTSIVIQCFLTRISLNATIHESPFIKLFIIAAKLTKKKRLWRYQNGNQKP